MKEKEAINLLNETFNNEFDLVRFSKFIKEVFNKFTIAQKIWTARKEYRDYIDSYQVLGNYKDESKNTIAVLVVKLKKASSRDRARTMQRNFIANYLSNAEKDAALVAFYGDDPQDWRFSFVKMEHQLTKDKTGNAKVLTELTPAKRYSFLVGVNEPNNTCGNQFRKIIQEENISPSLKEIEHAFSIENVTKEFFKRYRDLFLKLNDSLNNVIKNDSKVRNELNDRGIDTQDFTKKLLGQIVFLYFLQKKGWLGVEKDDSGKFKSWGTGPKDFMRCLFGDKKKKNKPLVPYENFFNEILEPLFYETLATDRDDDYSHIFKCKIPFLNGGLFEPINQYNWRETDILIDNNIFKDIFGVFDEFNFTVKEDEPLEKEVAVDPEMLGKVFENLLDIKDRKSKGAYYTPREIVHYMCQQSLINYLETNTTIVRTELERFIQIGEAISSSDQRLIENIHIAEEKFKQGKITIDSFEKELKENRTKLKLPLSIFSNKEQIDTILKDIKIVDPAVGSGAFLIGMLNEIVKARSTLCLFMTKQKSDYDLKREIIESCLYGVDIEPSAVEICKLRFWLSLVVDELDMRNIKPLPNLDHKIMCGNSLLEEFEGTKLFDERLLGIDIKASAEQITLDEALKKRIIKSKIKLKELQSTQHNFINIQNKKLKEQYRKDIDKLEWELIEETLKEQGNENAMQKLEQFKKANSKPFFLWKLHFSEVFQRDNPGFDVVIANPPYIDYRKIDSVTKSGLIYFNAYKYTKTGSIYVYFIEFGASILKKNGTLIYINPYQYLTADSGYGIRKFIIDNLIISKIVDVSHIKVFAEASTYTCINIFKKNFNRNNLIEIIRCNNLNELNKKGFTLIQEETKKDNYRINISEENSVLNRLSKVGGNLGDFCNIFCGTSASGFGKKIINAEKYMKLSANDMKKYNIIIKSSDVGKYFFKNLVNYIPKVIYPLNVINYFSKEKIFFTRMTKNIRCMYSNKLLFGGKINILIDFKLNLFYLLSLLNSSLLTYWYYTKFESKHLSGGYLGFDIPSVKEIPIKQISPQQQKPFIKLVDQILSITKDKDYLDNPNKQAKVKKLQIDIDKLVYKLYDLTPKEIKIVEESLN
ncbi:N-6 DNA methylase [Candidatus Woesearchaeota archaeon]|jgi:hypothetical protein|nr:N-6 DNA methylase [Candidatus Woesearchaeota archaeon]MBT7062757.1 N-6 DNA methylase [Candidatus Woesearchaeota archaeon]MBT7402400.1 N-6 DNA methylase [Candidatus Woesearchaeota archaeon]